MFRDGGITGLVALLMIQNKRERVLNTDTDFDQDTDNVHDSESTTRRKHNTKHAATRKKHRVIQQGRYRKTVEDLLILIPF